MPVKFTTSSAFARAIGVSPGTMTRYRQRDDFPVSTSPPWTGGDLSLVQIWRETLREDRAADYRNDCVADEVAKLRRFADEYEAQLKATTDG